MNLKERIRRILKEERGTELLRKYGLFDFLMYSGLNPLQLAKKIDLDALPKDMKYQFLDDTSDRLISRWISDYVDNKQLSSLMYTTKDGSRYIEIQYFGGGGVTGEKFDSDGRYYYGLVNLEYSELPEHIFNNLFEIVLYEIYDEAIYKKNRINESEITSKDERIVCDECGWSWDLSDGGNDPYTCHKCGHENEH